MIYECLNNPTFQYTKQNTRVCVRVYVCVRVHMYTCAQTQRDFYAIIPRIKKKKKTHTKTNNTALHL